MEQDLAGGGSANADRLEAVRLEFGAQVRRFEEAKAGLEEIVHQMEGRRSERELLRSSAFARLKARLDSLPVIEKAKGVLMAQQRCGPDEAFDLLRRASQRANIRVSVLAAQIVEQVASQPAGLSAAPGPSDAVAGSDRGLRSNGRPTTLRVISERSAMDGGG